MTSERWWPFRRVASAIVILTAGFLTLGGISESAAQAPQQWEFRGFSGSSGVSPITSRPFQITTTVTADGSFMLPLTCPSGPPFTLKGTMSRTDRSVTGTVLNSPCGTATVQEGSLDVPFPNAHGFSGLEIRLGEGVVAIAGRRITGNGGGDPLGDAATLADVAVISTSVQNRNIGLRLNSLRGGLGGGVSVSGLALAIKGESVPIGGVLTGMLGGGASADPSRAFGRLGIFANGLGSFGDQATTPQAAGYDFSTAGLTAGADYQFTDNVVLGAAFGYLRTKIDRTSTVSDSSINGYSLTIYGTYYIKDTFHVDSILTYGRNDYGIDRRSERLSSSGTGTTVDRITASTDGDQFSASASGGYTFTTGGLTVGPTGRVTYIRVHIDGYSEHGLVGSNAARIPDQIVESLTTGLSARATYVINTSWAVLRPSMKAEWEHEFKGNSRVLTGSLVSDPSTLLTTQTRAPDRDYFNLGIGITAWFRGVSAFVHYEEQLGRANFTNHSFTGGVKFAF